MLQKWMRVEEYIGDDFSDYQVVISHTRDSSPLEESNFFAALKRLEHLPGVEAHTFNHWAYGWVESIMLTPDAPAKTINEAEKILKELEDYPVLDEDDYYARLYDAAIEYWSNLPMEDRIQMCRESGVSIFVARRDSNLPSELVMHLESLVE